MDGFFIHCNYCHRFHIQRYYSEYQGTVFRFLDTVYYRFSGRSSGLALVCYRPHRHCKKSESPLGLCPQPSCGFLCSQKKCTRVDSWLRSFFIHFAYRYELYLGISDRSLFHCPTSYYAFSGLSLCFLVGEGLGLS